MKIPLFIITFFVSIVIFSSCSKKNVPPPTNTISNNNNKDTTKDITPSIVSKWEADSLVITYTISGFQVFRQDSIFTHGHSLIQIFNADSTGLLIDDTQSPPDTTAGNYYLANDSVYTLAAGQTSYVATGKYTLTATQLTLSQSQDSLGGIFTGTVYFTKQ
jgi:hypothetical protein